MPLGQTCRRQLEFLSRVQYRQPAAPIFIDHVRQIAPIRADVEALDIPLDVFGDLAHFVSDGVKISELAELAVLVADEVDAASVRGELRGQNSDFMAALIDRSDRARIDVRDVEVALVDRDVLP